MKIHIYYRHYNVSGSEPRRPEWFDYELCYIIKLLYILKNILLRFLRSMVSTCLKTKMAALRYTNTITLLSLVILICLQLHLGHLHSML